MIKKSLLTLTFLLLAASVVSAQTVVPAGPVSGTWNAAGSPYQVQGEIEVQTGNTLTVEAGVTVEFQGYYSLTVNGTLLVNGEEDNMVTFTATNTITGWHGVRFFNAPDGSTIDWTVFEYSHSVTGGVTERRGGALYCDNSNPDFYRCVFHQNSASWGGAAYTWYGSPTFENCTFYGNTAGDVGSITNVGGTPVVHNCIVWGNNGVAQLSATCATSYTDVEGGFTGAGNINEDPLFVDPDNGDFHLSEGSPCIDAGDPTSDPDPDESIADMGVFYFAHEPLPIPYNLTAELDSLTGEVTLTWNFDEGGTPGAIDTLIYDNGPTTSGYTWAGNTMSTRMSPDESCQLLTLLIYTFYYGDDGYFNAEVYEWAGSQPSTTPAYQEEVDAAESDFTVVDVSNENLFFTGDFNVGFGSVADSCYLGYDANLNNGRSWDLQSGSWSQWTEAYIIRAVVQYESGDIAILSPAPIEPAPTYTFSTKEKTSMISPLPPHQTDGTDDFIEFIVYRNSWERGRTADTTYVDELPGYSTFTYTVSALFDEGESFQSDPIEVTWYPVGVEPGEAGEMPLTFALGEAHPNPFNPTTTISYSLPMSTYANLVVYDISGREIATLVDGWMGQGQHEVSFDAAGLSSGVYLFELTAGENTATGKMVLMK